ncbi:MAG: FAD-binding protein [Alphaproteobacteria bacterium]|nr:FAD-binding protein [Alphaproteobacteria bacterium]
MSILIIAEHAEGVLKPSTLNAVAAGVEIQSHTGGDLDVLVAGHEIAPVASQAQAIQGVATVLTADSPAYGFGGAASIGGLIANLAGYSHVLAPATSYGKNIIPFAAAKQDVQAISDITAVRDAKTFVRPIYAGNAFATVETSDAIVLVTVRTTAFEAVADTGGSAAMRAVDVMTAEPTTLLRNELTKLERPELTSARVVVSGGRGMQNGENFAMLERVADKLGGAVGASRAAVDAGYVTNDYQVGQTGKVVAPELYLAVGISGAIQHLAGMKDSKVIAAINKDADAPIFQVADYGLVADLFTAIPELEETL